jgi:glucans biosynthesis protein
MTVAIDRRGFLLTTAAGLLMPCREGFAAAMPNGLGPAEPFTLDTLTATARRLAKSPWKAPRSASADILEKIDYDAYQQIRFKHEESLLVGRNGAYPIQLFHPGRLFKEPVRINTVQSGMAREVLYRSALFDSPHGHPARALPEHTGFAGFRVMAKSLQNDWLAFLGASYFRSSGPYNQYGLSARGLAIDTGLSIPEEFPRFSEFWLEGSAEDDAPLVVYALLDSPRATGAYRFRIERRTDTRDIHRVAMEVEARLIARGDIGRLGIAPFSSMFWYGETNRTQAADWRPEIHDSDGLAVHTGSGERIWRPILNPPRVMTNSFVDRDPKGFGLLQRDRDFVHYLDDGVFYERRPSVWVEPLEPWGEGAVHLVEIPTDDETNDNIVAYWSPKAPFRSGEERRYTYRLSWLDDIPFPETLARSTATWTGLGGRPGQKRPAGVKKFVIDFQGPVFSGLGRNDGVEIVVTASRGTVTNSYSHPVVDQRERWRAFFDLEATGSEPVDLRAFLRRGAQALTETWIFQYFPEQR